MLINSSKVQVNGVEYGGSLHCAAVRMSETIKLKRLPVYIYNIGQSYDPNFHELWSILSFSFPYTLSPRTIVIHGQVRQHNL